MTVNILSTYKLTNILNADFVVGFFFYSVHFENWKLKVKASIARIISTTTGNGSEDTIGGKHAKSTLNLLWPI